MDTRVPALVKKIVVWLVAQDFGAVDEYSRGVRLTADQIRQAVFDYGRKLILPPDSAFTNLDVIQVSGARHPTWSIRFDLWTAEEGRSDLTLECRVIDCGGEVLAMEVDNLRVL
ncbi:hypothetical protein [Polaromonas sp. YR568]|uniref:DUF7668 domain-containing protein n=1 Tax=Polaromonas sp. YR568 TaxID=1855301 RepID=UPI00398BF985